MVGWGEGRREGEQGEADKESTLRSFRRHGETWAPSEDIRAGVRAWRLQAGWDRDGALEIVYRAEWISQFLGKKEAGRGPSYMIRGREEPGRQDRE